MYMLFSIQIVINAIYSTINNTVMRLKSYGYYIDGVLFICFLTYVFIIYAYDRDGTWAYQKTQSSSTKSDQQIFYENYRNNGRREDILLIIIGVLFWCKVFYSLRLMPWIGPLQAILRVIMKPVFYYLVFFAVEILIFAAISHILFNDISSYNDYYNCLLTLFPSAIGSFDFTSIDNSTVISSGGKVFLVIFLLVNNLLIISYFIGMLVSEYKDREKYSVIFFSYTTLALRPVSLAMKNSCLISAPVPLNGLHFLHMPILLSIDEEAAIIMNYVILHIIYTPILIVQVILFLFWNFLLYPVVYVKIFLHKMTIAFTYSRIYRDERNNKFLYGIGWVIIGPIVLLINIFRDTVVFCIHLYRTDLEMNYFELRSDHFISNSFLEKCANILENYIEEGNRIVELTNAVTDIRSQINVDDAIFTKIYGQPPKGQDPELYTDRKIWEILQAFNIIKKMLVNNCSKIDNFDELVKGLVDNPHLIEVKESSVNVIDCRSILSFINDILTIRVLHKVLISEETDLFSKPLEKRKVLLKELETLYGTYKVDNELLSDRIIKQLETHMTRSIAYCNTKRVFDMLEFTPKNEKFLTSQSLKEYEKQIIANTEIKSLRPRGFSEYQDMKNNYTISALRRPNNDNDDNFSSHKSAKDF